jgi:putative membrane protein
MKSLKTTLAAATVALLCAPAASHAAMNDLEIAHTAYTAGQLDIRYAHLAMAISENESVRTFATTMIRDHSAVKGAAAKRDELSALRGKAFDCAYAQNELGYHQVVNRTVEGEFIPNVTVEPLKELLVGALATFKVHEQHAVHMVQGLACN